jgi:hypothetical protein
MSLNAECWVLQPKRSAQFNVRLEADRRLNFLTWLAEYRQIRGQSSWTAPGGRIVQVTDWLFVAATALLARTAPHDLALALAGFAEKVGITYDLRTETSVCSRACRAINRRRGGRWVSAAKAGGYLQVNHEERRAYYDASKAWPNIDPVGESDFVKRGRKTAERRERRRDQVRAKRRANGMLARGQYRAQVKRKTLSPWEALGLKKWTYYRRLKAGTLLVAVTPRNNPSCVQQGVSPRLPDLSNDFSAEPATRSVALWLRKGKLSEGRSQSLSTDTYLREKNSIELNENDGGQEAPGAALQGEQIRAQCRSQCASHSSTDSTPPGRSYPSRQPLTSKRLSKKTLPPDFNGPPPDGFPTWGAWNVANAPKPKLASG